MWLVDGADGEIVRIPRLARPRLSFFRIERPASRSPATPLIERRGFPGDGAMVIPAPSEPLPDHAHSSLLRPDVL